MPDAPTDGTPVDVLTSQDTVEFLADGRMRRSWYMVYRVLSRKGVDGWAETEASWSPWFQKRPEIRVRVISPEGRVQELDPKTIVEEPIRVQGRILSNRRRLRAALPTIQVGSVVEERTTTEDTQPRFRSGNVDWASLASTGVRRRHVRVTLKVEGDRKVTVVADEGTKPTDRYKKDGMRVSVWDAIPGLLFPKFESRLTPDYRTPYRLGFSSTRSWESASKDYFDISQPSFEGALETIKPLIQGIEVAPSRRASVLAAAGIIAKRLWKQTRYTGLELDESSIIPYPPAETLKRGYGDCKDLAVVMVASLKALGVNSQLALIRSAQPTDVDEKLPGLDHFDHVIVHVDTDPPIWVDLTASGHEPGAAPSHLQGKRALVARASRGGLVAVPVAASSENRWVSERHYTRGDDAVWSVVEKLTMTGESASRLYGAKTAQDWQKRYKDYVDYQYRADQFSVVPVVVERDRVELTLTVDVLGRATSKRIEESIYFDPNVVLTASKVAWPGTDKAPKLPREMPFWLSSTEQSSLTMRVTLPPGYSPHEPPTTETVQIGPSTLTVETSQVNGDLIVTYVHDSAQRQWTSGEVNEARRALTPFSTREELPDLTLRHDAGAKIIAGQFGAGFRALGKLWKQSPNNRDVTSILGWALFQSTFVVSSRHVLASAAETYPKSVDLLWQAGRAFASGDFGQFYGAGFDAKRALKLYERAVSLGPDQWPQARRRIGELHQELANGLEPKRLNALVSQVRASAKPESALVDLALVGLYGSKRYKDVVDIAKKAPNSRRAIGYSLCAQSQLTGVSVASKTLRSHAAADASSIAKVVLSVLLLGRQYELAVEWIDSAPGAFAAHAQTVRVARDVKRFEARSWKDTPGDVAARLYSAVGSDERAKIIKKTCTSALAKRLSTEEHADELSAPNPFGVTGAFFPGTATKYLVDIALIGKPSVQGDDTTGYLVSLPATEVGSVFVVPTKKGYRVASMGLHSEAVADRVLDLAKRGETVAAKTVLDWAVEAESAAGVRKL
ncbi:MAG: hypothetical protein ACI9OJ_006001, partial [Myxococcota bacterium]